MVKMRPLAGILAFLLFSSFFNSCVGDTGSETVVVFKGDETDVSYKDASGAIKKRRPGAFRLPAFVGGVLEDKEFFAVFSDAHYDGSSGSNVIAPAVRTSYGDYKKWSGAEDFANAKLKNGENEIFGKVTAVVKNGKIYALASRFDKSFTLAPASGGSTTGWDTVMLIGTVVKSTVSGGDAVTVMWEEEKSLKSLLKVTEYGQHVSAYFVGGVGNGVVMKSGTIVLPVHIISAPRNGMSPEASSIIYSTDNGGTWKMGKNNNFYSSQCSVVEWGNDKLLLSARSDWGLRGIFESDDMGASWTLSPVFMDVWKNNQQDSRLGSQGSVITAPVDEKDVLFFSHPLTTTDRHIRDTLQLWFSDGKRIVCIDTISGKDNKEHTGNSILAYVNKKLYITHEVNPFAPYDNAGTSHGELNKVIGFTPLPKFFESAEKTVRAWRRLDTFLEAKGIPTEWLVVFLGNTTQDNNALWSDMYNCVDATVTGGESVAGGFRFNGADGSGAKLSLRSPGQNQVYVFTEKHFTLTATVIIHKTGSAGDDSLIGARQATQKSDIIIGLGFTKDQKWYTVSGQGSKNLTQFAFQLEKEYHVALTFAHGIAMVYVDGLNITEGTRNIYSRSWIDHIYMGGKGQSSAATGSSCTVKNVMLFNRNLEQNEIAKLPSISKNNNLNEQIPPEKTIIQQQKEITELQIKTISEQEKPKTVTTEKQKNGPLVYKMVSTSNPKETAITKKQNISNENVESESINHSLRDYRGATLQKKMNHADGAAVSFAFVPFICVVCSIVVLAGG